MPTKCFLIERTRRTRLSLRRYSSLPEGQKCPFTGWIHDASNPLFDVNELKIKDDLASGHDWYYSHDGPKNEHELSPADATRFPTQCGCGYIFTVSNEKQVFTDALYKRADTGEIIGLRNAPPGAMWDAEWMPDTYGRGDDGLSLHVILPNKNHWHIDGIASNCTAPCNSCGVPVGNHPTPTCRFRDPPPHHCWVRHGIPPEITVDKNGNTCAAGAGSILSGDYHGFLQNGFLT